LPDVVDPYVDPTTGVLRNLVGAIDRRSLDDAEGALAFARLVQLSDHEAPGTRDLAELCGIHRHLFQDVYDWAGTPRIVDIRKNVAGAEHFLPWSMIERASAFAFDELRADDHLRGMDRPRFVERLAHHFDAVNYIHPFREGNGRAQRVLWGRVAETAGRRLDWRSIDSTTNVAACRAASERQDFEPLIALFDDVVVEAT